MTLCLMEGNEAISRGAVAAGCDFFAGYPITPATTIYNMMLQLLPPTGGICLQGEDEIASIGFCLGAAMAGRKVMTATSGPGISLYSEQLSFAVGSEIPIVIVDVQRLGPSTGSATKGADGDVQFLQWGNSGGQPIIALAPVDIKDCYTLTVHAFNLAERFRCPVFVAANKEISMTRETFDPDTLEVPAVVQRRMADPQQPYEPFAVLDDQSVPEFLAIGGDRLVRQTSSTHGPNGYITTDPQVIADTQARLNAKIHSHLDDVTFYDYHPTPGAKILVIAYGVTARSAAVAIRRAGEQNRPASLLVLKTLWPVPEPLLRRIAAPYDQVIMAEMNLGQYVREIQRVLPDKTIHFQGRMNGELLSPTLIQEMINHG